MARRKDGEVTQEAARRRIGGGAVAARELFLQVADFCPQVVRVLHQPLDEQPEPADFIIRVHYWPVHIR